MKTEDIDTKPLSDWIPETDPVRCAIWAKTQEELTELGKAIARCQAQGIEGLDPDTNEPNRAVLADELDDVVTMIGIIREQYAIRPCLLRQDKKYHYQQRWYKRLRDMFAGA